MPLEYNSHKVLTVIPIYDEVGKIGKVISKFSTSFTDEICVVLDKPSNVILKEIKKASQEIDVKLKIIKNTKRRGIGYAIKLGIHYSIKNNFDIIVVMAGNNKDDPTEIPRFLNAIVNDGYDYVQGSRFLPGGYHEKTPHFRGVFIKLYPLLWSILTNKECTDVTNGFRSYKTKIFREENINIWQDWLDSYELEYYIHYKVLTNDFKTKEVPVSKIYPYRNKGGYSKINPINDFWNILRPLFYLALGLRK
jgi:dolichol-phosphate mannosyltransferase